MKKIDKILLKAVELEASDVHIKANRKPLFRIDGLLEPMSEFKILDVDEVESLAYELMSMEIKKTFNEEFEADFSYALTVDNPKTRNKENRRFRVNTFMSKNTVRTVLRLIPNEILPLSELGLSKILYKVVEEPRGLILITGPTGSGKTTTIASLIEYINVNFKKHIITLEDPIEFVYESKKCLISQREIGQDTKSYKRALKRSLRQDPDIILLGELRDLETISTAVTLAETGHLVLATLHTTSAATTVDRLIDVFPATQQQQIRYQVSETLKCVVCQTLLRKPDGGRICASEILITEDSAKASIKAQKTHVLEDVMQSNAALGMHTLEQDLVRLLVKGEIDKKEALSATSRPDILKQLTPKNYSVTKNKTETQPKFEDNITKKVDGIRKNKNQYRR